MNHFWDIYEDLDEIVYISDMDTYEIIYLNRKTREMFGIKDISETNGLKCYEFFQHNAAPCAMCTNSRLKKNETYEWSYYNTLIEKIFTLRDSMTEYEGRRLRIETAIAQTTNHTHDTKGPAKMALLVNESMRMAMEENNPENGIAALLEYLGKSLRSDRSYIFEILEKNGKQVWNNTYEWCAYGVTPEKDFLSAVPYEATEIWMRNFSARKFVIIRDVETTKNTDPAAYEYLEPQNIHSLITGPLYSGDKLIGFYGIDNPPAERIDEVADMISTISHVIENMIDKRNMMIRLEQLSLRDPTLDMGNRHAMHLYFNGLDRNNSIGIVFTDVCGLKRINDTLGHAAGDKLLQRSCDCLKEAFSSYNLYRIGGDEMLILAYGIPKEKFEQCCRNLRLITLEKNIPLAVGTIWHPEIDETPDELISQADMAMYRDKVHFYEKYGLNKWRSENEWFGTGKRYEEIVECVHRGLDKAIAEGQFVVYYQPQYNQLDNSLYGAEALVRWMHPEKGILTPGRFIPYLEHNGMISMIDEFVLSRVCSDLRKWLDEGTHTVPVSVNLSRLNLHDDRICYIVKNILDKYGLKPDAVNLEITESAYIDNQETVIDIVKKFQNFGFKIEMDDFGSGYSSLNTLKDIPIDILKLDMKFMNSGRIDERSGKILSSVVRMAHWLAIPVIAEGVETAEQADFLRSIGCYYVQGYYFDKPEPVSEFEKILSNAKQNLQRDNRITEKNNHEIDFFSTDSFGSLILDYTSEACGITQYDGQKFNLMKANDSFIDLFNIEGNDIFQIKNADYFASDDDFQRYKKAADCAVESMDTAECTVCTKSAHNPGKTFWVYTHFKYLSGYDGLHILLITVKDVTFIRQIHIRDRNMRRIFYDMEKSGLITINITNDWYSDVNANAAKMLGYTSGNIPYEYRGKAISLVCDDDRKKLIDAIKSLKSSDYNIIDENIGFVCKDGRIRNFSVICTILNGSENNEFCLMIMLSDQNMSVINKNAAKYMSGDHYEKQCMFDIMDAMEIPFILYDESEGIILKANRQFAELTGYTSPDALQYVFLGDYIVTEDHASVHNAISESVRAKDDSAMITLRLKNINGRLFRTQAFVYVLNPDSDRREIYISFRFSDDLSGREFREIKQQKVEKIISENTALGVICYHIKGKRWKIDFMSEGVITAFKYSCSNQINTLISNDALALVHPDEREKIREIAIRNAKKHTDFNMRYHMLCGSGEYAEVLSHIGFTCISGELYAVQTHLNLTAFEAELQLNNAESTTPTYG